MRTKRRSKQHSVIAIVGALLFACALTLLALTRSTADTQPTAATSPLDLTPPYNDTAELAAAGAGATPDETLDLKKSSGQTVTIAMVERMRAQAEAVPAAADGIAWKQLGPYNIGGRMTDVVATGANTVIGSAASGGIWKSSDGGMNWTSIWPDENVQAMGAIAQAPDGTLWAGTGEANPPGGGLTYFGDGIYKSTDGGASWQHMGLPDSAAFGRIEVDPKNSNRVFAAASGHIARSVSQRGIYRTEDGGKTWERVITPDTPMTGGIDIEIHPTNSDIVYAALWDHKRTNGTRTYGGLGSGLFRSKDGGDTWERLENIVDPLPTYDQTQTGLKKDASLGRIGIALAPSNPNRLYVVAGGPTGPDKGFYFSDDGGDTLRVGGRAYAPNGGFQWWFGKIWVDPEDQNHIFNADVSLRRSTDGGMTWAAVGNGGTGRVGIHADQQAMDFDPTTIDGDPATPVRVWLGNDGGMWRSDADGAPNTWDKAQNQPWNQSYHLAVSPFDWKRQIVGLQDNGSNKSWTPQEPSPADEELRTWSGAGGGDGHYNAIDPQDDRIYYTCSQSSGGGTHSCGRRTDSATGTTTASVAQIPNSPGNRYTTDAPIVIDPNQPPLAQDGTQPPNAVYVAGNYVGRSLNRGTTMTRISPLDPTPADPTDPTPSLGGAIPASEIDIGLYTNLYGAVTTLAPAKSPTPVPYANLIYAGTDTGLVWRTKDAGETWEKLSGLPSRWVNKIVADPDDPNHVYIAFSGFRQGDDSASVWESKDGGDTWKNVSYNMPNGPVEMLEYDPKGNVLFAATDVGVFDLKDGDTSWYKVSVGLPNAPMLDLKLSGDGKRLIVASFGRSNFVLPLFTDAVDGGGAGGAAGTVPATLSLTVGSASFPAFTPGIQKEYEAKTTANVISTAGDATLSVSEPGRMTNGAFSLAEPLRVEFSKATWTQPVSNDPVDITFKQLIKSSDPLRTGTYSKTLTFTLSTTNP